MLRSYKTEILPNPKQALKIRQTLGICRYLYNLYLASNFKVYEILGKGFFVTAYTFDKYVNHVVKKEFPWIDDCGGTISYKAGQYYVSVLVEVLEVKPEPLNGEGIGIDLGVKELAVMSDGTVKPNINKTPRVKKLERKLRREQRRLSRKYEFKRKRGEKTAAYSANIERQVVKIQRLYQTLTNIRVDYENKIISEIVKRKPSFIVLEDLNAAINLRNATEYELA